MKASQELPKNLQQRNNSQTSSLSSNILARNLINSCYLQKHSDTQDLLITFKEKKNNNYDKFANYIGEQLALRKDIDLQITYQMLRDIEATADIAGNGDSQIKAIANGFRKYWSQARSQENESSRRELNRTILAHYFEFSGATSEVIAVYLVDSLGAKRGDKIKDMIVENITFRGPMSCQKSRKCCNLISAFNLYEDFEVKDLAYIASFGKIEQIIKFFKTPLGILHKALCEAYILNKMHSEAKKEIKRLISEYKLDPFQYPAYIKVLNKRCLRHYFATEPIYVTELKIAGRPDMIECVIEELIDSKKFKEAIHFINKFKVKKFYHLRGDTLTCSPNFLLHHDYFAPTQVTFNKKLNKNSNEVYISMQDFGLNQADVLFMSSDNWKEHQQQIQSILKAPRIGIDSQNVPAYNPYEEKNIALLQIAPETINPQDKNKKVEKVFLFDLLSLKNKEYFKDWFISLVQGSKSKIVGHSTKLDVNEILQQLNLKVSIKTEIADVQTEFRKQNPKDSKSSLQYLCTRLLDKKLSKYEQCSGWHNRPLRKAQLHYAALDAVLPLKIMELLEQK